MVLVRGQLGELDYELELALAPVGGRGAGGATVGAGVGARRLAAPSGRGEHDARPRAEL